MIEISDKNVHRLQELFKRAQEEEVGLDDTQASFDRFITLLLDLYENTLSGL